MKEITNIDEVQCLRGNLSAGSKLGFVPTMGALHEGHLSLIKKGKEFGLSIMVTIFVNEMQFNSKEDFNNYPTKIEL